MSGDLASMRSEAPLAVTEAVAEVLPAAERTVIPAAPAATIDWTKLGPEAQDALRHARAPATLKAYRQDWAQFVSWCRSARLPELPSDPHDVACYLAHLGSTPTPKSISKIQRSAAAIAYAHRIASAPYDRRHPAVVEVIESLRRKLGTAPKNQKRPLVEELVARVCAPLGSTRIDVRDRAMLLLGFLSACRASNLVALDVSDVTFTERGVDLVLRRSKTDQTGDGFLVAVPAQPDPHLCGGRALRTWLDGSGLTEGPLFCAVDRHGHLGGRLAVQEVRRMVRRRAERVGLTPTGSKDFGSHSLRSGFCTSAAEAGRSVEEIMTQTGHRRADSAIRYVRHANRYAHNAATGLLGSMPTREVKC